MHANKQFKNYYHLSNLFKFHFIKKLCSGDRSLYFLTFKSWHRTTAILPLQISPCGLKKHTCPLVLERKTYPALTPVRKH